MENMEKKLTGFGTAWLERQVIIYVCVGDVVVVACGSACLHLWAICSRFYSWVTSLRAKCISCVSFSFVLLHTCVAFSVNKLQCSIPQSVLQRPGWPVKRYVSHQSLRELWPLKHCQQPGSCHLLHTYSNIPEQTHSIQIQTYIMREGR